MREHFVSVLAHDLRGHEAGTTFTIELPLDARLHQLAFEGAVVPPSGSVH